jgi:hypothetical protein
MEQAWEIAAITVSIGLLLFVLATLPCCMRSAAREYQRREEEAAAAASAWRASGGRGAWRRGRFGSSGRARALQLAAAVAARGAVLMPADAELRKRIASTARPFSAGRGACGSAAAAAAAAEAEAAAEAAARAAAHAANAAAVAAVAAADAADAAAAAGGSKAATGAAAAASSDLAADTDADADNGSNNGSGSSPCRSPSRCATARGETSEMCAICFEPYGEGDLIAVLPPCRHAFHGFCVDQWLARDASCPVCKACLDPQGRARVAKERRDRADEALEALSRRQQLGGGSGRAGWGIDALPPLTPEELEAERARRAEVWRRRREHAFELWFGDGSGGVPAPRVEQPAAVLERQRRQRERQQRGGGGDRDSNDQGVRGSSPTRHASVTPALSVVEERTEALEEEEDFEGEVLADVEQGGGGGGGGGERRAAAALAPAGGT